MWTCGSALFAGEDGPVDLCSQFRIGGENDCAARPVQGLVGGGGDDVGIADRGRDDASRHQPADMRDISQQVGSGRVRDLAELLPIRESRGRKSSRR